MHDDKVADVLTAQRTYIMKREKKTKYTIVEASSFIYQRYL